MKAKLNSNWIKIIAILAMTIDHIAWLVFPGYSKEVFPIIHSESYLLLAHPERAAKHNVIASIVNNIRFIFAPFLVVVVE